MTFQAILHGGQKGRILSRKVRFAIQCSHWMWQPFSRKQFQLKLHANMEFLQPLQCASGYTVYVRIVYNFVTYDLLYRWNQIDWSCISLYQANARSFQIDFIWAKSATTFQQDFLVTMSSFCALSKEEAGRCDDVVHPTSMVDLVKIDFDLRLQYFLWLKYANIYKNL